MILTNCPFKSLILKKTVLLELVFYLAAEFIGLFSG